MKKFLNVKTISLLLAVVLLVGGAVGGTLAWIIDSKSVTNTFTYGDINITLDETELDSSGQPTSNRTETGNDNYIMIPGQDVLKDPKVTVAAESEACWLFVKLEEFGGATIDGVSYGFDKYLTYEVDSAWTALDATNYPGVYYKEVSGSNSDQEFNVIKDNKLSVPGDVTKTMLNALDATAGSETYPTLKITAYAIQKTGFNTAAAAWTEASK